VPGTFQHTYLLQRQINGKPEGQEQAYHINFNAVKITINKITFMWIGIKFSIKIEDGINVKDRYLSPEKATQTYSILYNKRTSQGEKQGEFIVFPSFFQQNGTVISEFHIIQQYPNQEPYEIIYYNINF